MSLASGLAVFGCRSAGIYQEGSPSALDARSGPYRAVLAPHCHPRLGRVGTNLSYCNGEIGLGSSNITLYMVWAYPIPPCIAQTLHHPNSLRLRREIEVGERREHNQASARTVRSAMSIFARRSWRARPRKEEKKKGRFPQDGIGPFVWFAKQPGGREARAIAAVIPNHHRNPRCRRLPFPRCLVRRRTPHPQPS